MINRWEQYSGDDETLYMAGAGDVLVWLEDQGIITAKQRSAAYFEMGLGVESPFDDDEDEEAEEEAE